MHTIAKLCLVGWICVLQHSVVAEETPPRMGTAPQIDATLQGLNDRLAPVMSTAKGEVKSSLSRNSLSYWGGIPAPATPAGADPAELATLWTALSQLHVEITISSDANRQTFPAALSSLQKWEPGRVVYFQRFYLAETPPLAISLIDIEKLKQPREAVDRQRDHWAYDALAHLATAGIVPGYNAESFRSGKALTRYEMAAIIAGVLRSPDPLQITLDDLRDAICKSGNVGCTQWTYWQYSNDAVDALTREFRDELGRLGVPVDDLERRVHLEGRSPNKRLEFGARKGDFVWLYVSSAPGADAKLLSQIKQTVSDYCAERRKANAESRKNDCG